MKKLPKQFDERSLVISQNVERLRNERGWSFELLAGKVHLSRTHLARLIDIGASGYKQWRALDLVDLAQAFGVSVETLLKGTTVPTSGREFNPLIHDAQVMIDKFAEHERSGQDFVSFNRLSGCIHLSGPVQQHMHRSVFGECAGTLEGTSFVERWNDWGDSRRAGYLVRSKGDLPRTISLMPRRDFERLVNRKPPFEYCTLQQVADCLEYIRRRCVIERGFRLLLLDDDRLGKFPDLGMSLNAIVGMGVIGKYFAYRKLGDYSVVWNEHADDVRHFAQILRRLTQLASHGSDEKAVLTELDHYQRRIDNQLKFGSENSRHSRREHHCLT